MALVSLFVVFLAVILVVLAISLDIIAYTYANLRPFIGIARTIRISCRCMSRTFYIQPCYIYATGH
jgi:hypothetical protein